MESAVAQFLQRRLEARILRQRDDEEARKLAEAHAAKAIELERMKKDKAALEASSKGAEGNKEGPIFEEKWADVILSVKKALQIYKRW